MKTIRFLFVGFLSIFCLWSLGYSQNDQQINKKIYDELTVIQELQKELELVKALDSETTVKTIKKEDIDMKIMRYLVLTVLALGAGVLSYKVVHAFTHRKNTKKGPKINIKITDHDGLSGTYTLVPAKH